MVVFQETETAQWTVPASETATTPRQPKQSFLRQVFDAILNTWDDLRLGRHAYRAMQRRSGRGSQEYYYPDQTNLP